MSLNCPSTTAVALKSGAGLPILAFPDDMVAVVARYCSRDSTAHVDKHSWVEPEAPPAALTAVTPTSGFKPSAVRLNQTSRLDCFTCCLSLSNHLKSHASHAPPTGNKTQLRSLHNHGTNMEIQWSEKAFL